LKKVIKRLTAMLNHHPRRHAQRGGFNKKSGDDDEKSLCRCGKDKEAEYKKTGKGPLVLTRGTLEMRQPKWRRKGKVGRHAGFKKGTSIGYSRKFWDRLTREGMDERRGSRKDGGIEKKNYRSRRAKF